ncbi:MAG: RtcB family protein [Ruminococcaceae bacterium]|nr:RtcB family protein [Oscillospiraceae bacterium]
MYDIEIYAESIDGVTTSQIYAMANQLPFRGEKIRIMPDTHAGLGCVVGFTATMSSKVIPNVIGVDIGCGMRTVELGKTDFSFTELDNFIKKSIPSGSDVRKTHSGEEFIKRLRCKELLTDMPRLLGSLGTLGGGNHFIEVDIDSAGNKYLVIHTGSRNLGTQVAKIYQKKAVNSCKNVSEMERKALIARLKNENRQADIPNELIKLTEKYAFKTKIPAELCYLEGGEAEDYLFDMRICQEFAEANRHKIAELILKHLGISRAPYFETVHNFIGDDNIVRKGAIPARLGERVLIPMNMRDGCLIAEGLGNPDWNFSAPHGAGRLLSRGEAKQLLTVEEYTREMEGIFTTTANASTLDEAPMAYKPMDEIVRLIEPTVKILSVIKPIYNFKASEI